MNNADAYLGKMVVARSAQGDLVGVGKCVGFCDSPTVTINTKDGQIHYRADMCQVVPLKEDEIVALGL